MDSQQGSLRNEDLPAMFWDALPENAEEHPDMAAIQALLAESTPEELAENFRVWGCPSWLTRSLRPHGFQPAIILSALFNIFMLPPASHLAYLQR